MSVKEDKTIVKALIAGDPKATEDFFFRRCRASLTYIATNYCPSNIRETPESFIGDVYSFLKENDWHRLRIFRYTCSLTSYVAMIARRYFQGKRNDKEVYWDSLLNQKDELFTEASDSFAEQDVNCLVEAMKPLDRFLIRRVLLGGEKPGDVLEDVRPLLKASHLEAMNQKQFAGYIYTRLSKVRQKLQIPMRALGYGA